MLNCKNKGSLMAQATHLTRDEEIQEIHRKYADFYKISGGLSLILLGIWIGSLIFGAGYGTNVYTEALSVAATIVVIDQLNRRRAREERKAELFRQAKSRSNDFAVDALRQIQDNGWWEDLLKHYPGVNENYRTDLFQVQWAGGVPLARVDLQEADLSQANLQGAKLREANLQNANLIYANLQGASLRQANLQQANLWCANLQGVFSVSANLQTANLIFANLQGADLYEANLQETSLGRANLRGASLFRANLQGASLSGANLQGAKLWEANLQGVFLVSANLQGAKLSKTNLQGADLSYANLQGVRLGNVNLQGANLYEANLRGAYLGKDLFDEKTVLPDAKNLAGMYEEPEYDKYWTPETDMSRYTNPKHPDFWEPYYLKEGHRPSMSDPQWVKDWHKKEDI